MEYAQLKPGKGFKPVQSLLYYLQRAVTMPLPRRAAMRCIRMLVKKRANLPTGLGQAAGDMPGMVTPLAATLEENGYCSLGQLLDAAQLAEVHAYLQGKVLQGSHRQATPMTIENVPAHVSLADYGLADLVDCPHLLALANSAQLLQLATAYLGCAPTISSLALRWSFPGNQKAHDLQTFHRDADDWKFVKVFVYLTSVDLDAGPHIFVQGSHRQPMNLRLKFFDDQQVADVYGAEKIKTFTGAGGYGFAVDTAGVHKGAVPNTTARLMLTIQYSMLPHYAYHYRPTRYQGPLQLDQYVNRLIVHQGSRRAARQA